MEFIQQYYQSFSKAAMQHLVNILGPRGVTIAFTIFSTTYELLHAIALFNWRILGSIIDEFSSVGNLWVFHSENQTPIPYQVFGDHPESAKWFYNKNVNTLYESMNCISDRCPPTTCAKLPWIMSHLSLIEKDSEGNEITKNEWFLDEWASHFYLTVYDSFSVSPKVILNCWSLNSGIWMDENKVYRLSVINKNGEHIEFNDINHALSEELTLKWRSILGLESLPLSASTSRSESIDEDSRSIDGDSRSIDEDAEEEGSEDDGDGDEDGDEDHSEIQEDQDHKSEE